MAVSIDSVLRENGIDPSAVVSYERVSLSDVRPLEGWHARASQARAERISMEHGHDLRPILVVDRGAGYETVDGEGRAEAARLIGKDSIRALVMSERAFEALFPEYGEERLERWAHRRAGTGYE